MAYRLEHPFSAAVYAGLADGRVEVTKDGRTGIFAMDGSWLSGELRTADPELIRWVGSNGYSPASRHLAGFAEEGIRE
ncbi:MAG TPA: hypothetical protein VGJ14_19965 [Sporichthyaceae bacterium]